MIFEAIYESAQRGELLLIDGGYCRYRLRRDGVLVIREIISLTPGRGKAMLDRLKRIQGAKSILAKCPLNLPANSWYARNGFRLLRQEMTPSRRWLQVWELSLGSSTALTETPGLPGLPSN